MCVPHFMQEENWDCGLASLRMVLCAAKPELSSELFAKDALLEIVQTESIWTIDLAAVLAHFETKFAFYTVSTMVNTQDYKGIPFYHGIDNDEERVNRYFREAEKLGITIVTRSLSDMELRGILNGDLPLVYTQDRSRRTSPRFKEKIVRCAIILVDISIMRAESDPTHQLKRGIKGYGAWFLETLQMNFRANHHFHAPHRHHSSHSYSGHYIVLTGYDDRTNQYTYRDPASSHSVSHVHWSVLEKARKATGTDEDIIFVELNASRQKSAM